MLLRREDFHRHGWTVGCDLCDRMRAKRGLRGVHSKECRERMEERLRHDAGAQRRVAGAANRFARYAEDLAERTGASPGGAERANGSDSHGDHASGMKINLRGLARRPDLNGQLVTLLRFHTERGRWEAELASGEKVNVLPVHLAPPTAEEEDEGSKRRRLAPAEESETTPQRMEPETVLPRSPLRPPPEPMPPAAPDVVIVPNEEDEEEEGPAKRRRFDSPDDEPAQPPIEESGTGSSSSTSTIPIGLIDMLWFDSGESMTRNGQRIKNKEIDSLPRVTPVGDAASLGPVVDQGLAQGGGALDLTAKDSQGRPWDFDDERSRQRVRNLIRTTKPMLLIGAPMHTWFFARQGAARDQVDGDTFQENYRRAVRHLDFALELYALQIRAGRYFAHSHPQAAGSWREQNITDFVMKHDSLHTAVTDMGIEPMRWLTNSECIGRHLERLKGTVQQEEVEEKLKGDAVCSALLCRTLSGGMADQLKQDIQCLAEVTARTTSTRSSSLVPALEWLEEENLDLSALEDSPDEDAEAYDDMKGGQLDPKLVRAARLEELRYLWDRVVYIYSTRSEASRKGKRPVKLKWLDTNKGDVQSPNYRARLVCQEIRRKGWEAIFSATPPLESLRLLLSVLASEDPGRRLIHCDFT